jgi:N-ethylmaleimide reductase
MQSLLPSNAPAVQPPGVGLFSSVRLGLLTLRNRIVMSAMTRCRAGADGVPSPLMAQYYAQRASVGLVTSESAWVDERGIAFLNSAGIASGEHVHGWMPVVQAVHRRGAPMVCQLFHAGRLSHSRLTLSGAKPLAPSPIAAPGHAYVSADAYWIDGIEQQLPLARDQRDRIVKAPFEVPAEASLADIRAVIAAYAKAAESAFDAGFDMVELHGGSGYLFHQFISDKTNLRSDRYGGSAANRCRLWIETLEALCALRGSDRVGVKIGPGFGWNGMTEGDIETTYAHLVGELNRLRVAYLHIQRVPPDFAGPDTKDMLRFLRPRFHAATVAGAGFTGRADAETALAGGDADLIAFARAVLANPDLPERLHAGAALAPADIATFYLGGPKGYVDYPSMNQPAAAGIDKGVLQ